MADTVDKVHTGFENYRLHDAADAVRRFIVEDVCDVYVEFSKATLNNPSVQAAEKVTTLMIHMKILLTLITLIIECYAGYLACMHGRITTIGSSIYAICH